MVGEEEEVRRREAGVEATERVDLGDFCSLDVLSLEDSHS